MYSQIRKKGKVNVQFFKYFATVHRFFRSLLNGLVFYWCFRFFLYILQKMKMVTWGIHICMYVHCTCIRFFHNHSLIYCIQREFDVKWQWHALSVYVYIYMYTYICVFTIVNLANIHQGNIYGGRYESSALRQSLILVFICQNMLIVNTY